MVGQGGQAAKMPNISCLVAAVCTELSRIHPERTTICSVRVNHWAAVMRDYICIQQNILTNPVLMAQTRIQLFPLNQRTLAQWHYVHTRELVRRVLEMAVPLPSNSALASEPAPAIRPRPTGPKQTTAQDFVYHDPPDLSGQAKACYLGGVGLPWVRPNPGDPDLSLRFENHCEALTGLMMHASNRMRSSPPGGWMIGHMKGSRRGWWLKVERQLEPMKRAGC
ncbi:uncharacterized protein LOC127527998 [Erpetoichthys calabaricus]|uniref:uncharacterized protein LOC127527998 n=1 Tax=Erpetoichthys calabaricus TaxID=27687 RepID=UPI0022345326|nr:uncharacterized protein LOC127527998 [Erpetoichthys calabaricus]